MLEKTVSRFNGFSVGDIVKAHSGFYKQHRKARWRVQRIEPITRSPYAHLEAVRIDAYGWTNTLNSVDLTVVRRFVSKHADCVSNPLKAGDIVQCVRAKGMREISDGHFYVVKSVRAYEGTITVMPFGERFLTPTAGYAPWRFQKVPTSVPTSVPTFEPKIAAARNVQSMVTNLVQGIEYDLHNTKPCKIEGGVGVGGAPSSLTSDIAYNDSTSYNDEEEEEGDGGSQYVLHPKFAIHVGDIVRLWNAAGLLFCHSGDIGVVEQTHKGFVKINWLEVGGKFYGNLFLSERPAHGWYDLYRFRLNGNEPEFRETEVYASEEKE